MSQSAAPQDSDSAPFSVLTELFDRLQNEKKPEKRRRMLETWFLHWRQDVGDDLYPVLRLILPQKDRERATYGLKEKNLAKTYIKLIPLGSKDSDAIRLLNWKKPADSDKYNSSGDFPTVLYEVVSKRSSVIEGSLSVHEVNGILNELSENMGKNDIQSKILQRVYNCTTAADQRWIVRIILKDMNIFVKETTVFAVFHLDAQDLFNTCSDLKKVSWELRDPSRRLNAEDKEVQLFRAFAPMLCKRPNSKIEDSIKEMQGREFYIEEKLDGERMQLHKRGSEYFYCSRKGKDYTYLYGKHVGTGSLTPFLDAAFDSRVSEIILDGEMLVWDPVSERNLPFGTLKTAALDKSKKENNPRPCFKIFDLLYLNGMSLLHKSCNFRKRNMRACIKEIPGRIEYTTEFTGKGAKDVRERMEEIVASRGEGLVLKHPDSEYVLNGRNKDWIKVKPEYMDNMGETVDVLVVGGNYGSGKRGGGVSALICAVRDDRHAADANEPVYSTFVRIGTGLSFANYVWIREKPWKEWDSDSPPAFLQTSKKGQDDKGDVYLEPEDSFILKVKAAEITATDQYHLGFTMRFPRAMMIREELSISDCMTASAVLESVREERKRKMEVDAGAPKKKRKGNTKQPIVLPGFQGIDVKDVEVESDLFEGINFLVSADPKSKTGEQDKHALMRLIYANGGRCSLTPNQQDLLIVYGGTKTPYDLSMLIKKGTYDIIKPKWIEDSIRLRHPAPLRKGYFFHATDKRKTTSEYLEDDELDMEMTEPNEAGLREHEDQDVAINNIANQGGTSLSGWLDVGAEMPSTSRAGEDNTDTESDADSFNDDVRDAEEQEVAEDDQWTSVKEDAAMLSVPQLVASDSDVPVDQELHDDPQREDGDHTMGETEEAMEYDPELIFKHTCFYFDSPENARRNGMKVNVKTEIGESLKRSFGALSRAVVGNGGRVGDLNDPKLTHVVIDPRDASRRLELMKRTSQPKRRNIVVTDFIQACLDEGTLLNEEDFIP